MGAEGKGEEDWRSRKGIGQMARVGRGELRSEFTEEPQRGSGSREAGSGGGQGGGERQLQRWGTPPP